VLCWVGVGGNERVCVCGKQLLLELTRHQARFVCPILPSNPLHHQRFPAHNPTLSPNCPTAQCNCHFGCLFACIFYLLALSACTFVGGVCVCASFDVHIVLRVPAKFTVNIFAIPRCPFPFSTSFFFRQTF